MKLQVMDLVVKENLILHERRISLSEFHAADEVCALTFRNVVKFSEVFS